MGRGRSNYKSKTQVKSTATALERYHLVDGAEQREALERLIRTFTGALKLPLSAPLN